MFSCVVIVVMLFGLLSYGLNLTEEWNNFKQIHKRYFPNKTEEAFRRSTFEQHLIEIEDHNERFRRGLESYSIGVNKFTDYPEEELLSYTHGLREALPAESVLNFSKSASLPEFFDWRDFGMVTPIKNQINCASCWAFAAVGALESHYKIYHRTTAILSEQYLIDCVSPSGCVGGWMTKAYAYIIQNGGISYEQSYPYRGDDTGYCQYQPPEAKVIIENYVSMQDIDEDTLKEIVVTKGPVSVAIDSTGNFARYSSGVFYNPFCSTNRFTHAVVVVGYGSENGYDYWLIKNSWGFDWGLEGYIKMARKRGNHCGIASKVSYPVF